MPSSFHREQTGFYLFNLHGAFHSEKICQVYIVILRHRKSIQRKSNINHPCPSRAQMSLTEEDWRKTHLGEVTIPCIHPDQVPLQTMTRGMRLVLRTGQ